MATPPTPFNFGPDASLERLTLSTYVQEPKTPPQPTPPVQIVARPTLEALEEALTRQSSRNNEHWPALIRVHRPDASPVCIPLDPLVREALASVERHGAEGLLECPFKDPKNDRIIPRAVGEQSPLFLEPDNHALIHSALEQFLLHLDPNAHQEEWTQLVTPQIQGMGDFVDIQPITCRIVCKLLLKSLLNLQESLDSLANAVEAILDPRALGLKQQAWITYFRHRIQSAIEGTKISEGPEGECHLVKSLLKKESLSPEVLRDGICTLILHTVATLGPLVAFGLRGLTQSTPDQQALRHCLLTSRNTRKAQKILDQLWEDCLLEYGGSIRPRTLEKSVKIDTNRGSFTLPKGDLVDIFHPIAGHHPLLEELAEPLETLKPFGVGPHRCCGAQLAKAWFDLIISCMAQHYQVHLVCQEPQETLVRRRVEIHPKLILAFHPLHHTRS